MADAGAGRANQKSRTRKDLLRAAAALMRDGRSPTLEEVAVAAMVSRATAYRYFPGIEALLTEAALDIAMPESDILLADGPAEPLDRLLCVDAAVAEMVRDHEPALRAMLIHSLQQGLAGGADGLPLRQNRRTPLIEAALAPATLPAWIRDRLTKALALVIGTEARIAFRDVLRLPDEEADAVRRWMIRALFEAARRA